MATVPRRRRRTRSRAENMSQWVDEPLQNLIRDELDRRKMTISDLARAIDSQPSLVSRWMQGQRPNTESLAIIGDVLGIDVLKLLELAGHIPPGVLTHDDDERLTALFITMRQISWTDDRHGMVRALVDWMRDNDPPGGNGLPAFGPA